MAKRLKYQFNPKNGSRAVRRMKVGDYVTWREELLSHDFYNIDQNPSVRTKYPILQITGREPSYDGQQYFKCFPLNPRRGHVKNSEITAPPSHFRFLKAGEMEAILKKMGMFNMYRPLMVRTHPFTQIFR
jgi:hypothetical protein